MHSETSVKSCNC